MFQDLLKRIEINELNQMNRPLKALDGSVGVFQALQGSLKGFVNSKVVDKSNNYCREMKGSWKRLKGQWHLKMVLEKYEVGN